MSKQQLTLWKREQWWSLGQCSALNPALALLPSSRERSSGMQDCGSRSGRTEDCIKGEGDGAASLIIIKNRLKETLAFSIVINELFNFRP